MAKAAVTCLTPEASTILMNPKLDIHWLFSLNVQPGIRGDGVHVFKCDFYEISFWLVWLPVEPGVMQMMHHVVDSEQVLALPVTSISIAGSPRHWCTDHPPGKGPDGNARDGQTLALHWVHQNVVHWRGRDGCQNVEV